MEAADVRAERARLKALGGIDIAPEPMQPSGAPLRFMLRDAAHPPCACLLWRPPRRPKEPAPT